MSGWLLFFLFIAIAAMPTKIRLRNVAAPSAAVMVGLVVCWAAVVLGLLAGTLRSGGLL
jgi:hypothetical protein